MQILEGPRTNLAKCFMRIMMDVRHHDIHVLVAGDTNERLFAEWSMYSINADRIPKEVITPYLVDESFHPQKYCHGELQSSARSCPEPIRFAC